MNDPGNKAYSTGVDGNDPGNASNADVTASGAGNNDVGNYVGSTACASPCAARNEAYSIDVGSNGDAYGYATASGTAGRSAAGNEQAQFWC